MQIGETYDWRLGVPNLEVRDGYFTRLKHRIEITHHLNHEKASLCSVAAGLLAPQDPKNGKASEFPSCK